MDPFNWENGLEPIHGDFFDVCPPSGYILTSSDESYQSNPGVCSGGASSYQYRINQTLQLVVTFENFTEEGEYSTNQTWGLFSLGVGVPAIISSIAFLNSGSDTKLDKIAKLLEELKEKNQ